MTFEIGKRYRLRCGSMAKVIRIDEGGLYPIKSERGEGPALLHWHSRDGQSCTDHSSYDLLPGAIEDEPKAPLSREEYAGLSDGDLRNHLDELRGGADPGMAGFAAVKPLERVNPRWLLLDKICFALKGAGLNHDRFGTAVALLDEHFPSVGLRIVRDDSARSPAQAAE